MFIRKLLTFTFGLSAMVSVGAEATLGKDRYTSRQERAYNAPYKGEYLAQVAFPLGGIGAGMVCLEGNGCLSHESR